MKGRVFVSCYFLLYFLPPFTWKITMKPCVIFTAINSATEKTLLKSSTSEHLSAPKPGFFAVVHKLCEAQCKHTFPSKCLSLCKHLLPSCVLPEMILSSLACPSPWCWTVDPHIPVVLLLLSLSFLSSISYSLLVYLSLSLVVDYVAPSAFSSLCHLCCPSSFFFSSVNLSPLLL